MAIVAEFRLCSLTQTEVCPISSSHSCAYHLLRLTLSFCTLSVLSSRISLHPHVAFLTPYPHLKEILLFSRVLAGELPSDLSHLYRHVYSAMDTAREAFRSKPHRSWHHPHTFKPRVCSPSYYYTHGTFFGTEAHFDGPHTDDTISLRRLKQC